LHKNAQLQIGITFFGDQIGNFGGRALGKGQGGFGYSNIGHGRLSEKSTELLKILTPPLYPWRSSVFLGRCR
jgi:hypothetical protein